MYGRNLVSYESESQHTTIMDGTVTRAMKILTFALNVQPPLVLPRSQKKTENSKEKDDVTGYYVL